MNIFYTDPDPILAAINLIDLHVNKMITESSQILGSSIYQNGYDGSTELPKCSKNHLKHPSVVSVINNRQLSIWLVKHSLHLCKMYTDTTDKIHKSQERIEYMYSLVNKFIPDNGTIDSILCACDKYNNLTKDSITNYRYFYVNSKICIASWNNPSNKKPCWFNKLLFDKGDSIYFLEKRNKTRKNKIPLIQLESNINQYLG